MDLKLMKCLVETPVKGTRFEFLKDQSQETLINELTLTSQKSYSQYSTSYILKDSLFLLQIKFEFVCKSVSLKVMKICLRQISPIFEDRALLSLALIEIGITYCIVDLKLYCWLKKIELNQFLFRFITSLLV